MNVIMVKNDDGTYTVSGCVDGKLVSDTFDEFREALACLVQLELYNE